MMSLASKWSLEPYLDEGGRVLLQQHVAWWGRRAGLFANEPDVPMGRLWLPLADGSEAQEDTDLRPEALDLDRLAGEAQEPGPLRFVGDMIETRAPYARVPWVEARQLGK